MRRMRLALYFLVSTFIETVIRTILPEILASAKPTNSAWDGDVPSGHSFPR